VIKVVLLAYLVITVPINAILNAKTAVTRRLACATLVLLASMGMTVLTIVLETARTRVSRAAAYVTVVYPGNTGFSVTRAAHTLAFLTYVPQETGCAMVGVGQACMAYSVINRAQRRVVVMARVIKLQGHALKDAKTDSTVSIVPTSSMTPPKRLWILQSTLERASDKMV